MPWGTIICCDPALVPKTKVGGLRMPDDFKAALKNSWVLAAEVYLDQPGLWQVIVRKL